MNQKNNPKQDLYKRVYLYALKVIKFIKKLPKDSTSQIIGNQLLRSGTSVSANLIEAKSASSKKDYINFYQHALKSANESKLWVGLLRDTNKVDKKEVEELLKETSEIANILASSILTMKGKK
jgi:four helix bundle protein